MQCRAPVPCLCCRGLICLCSAPTRARAVLPTSVFNHCALRPRQLRYAVGGFAATFAARALPLLSRTSCCYPVCPHARTRCALSVRPPSPTSVLNRAALRFHVHMPATAVPDASVAAAAPLCCATHHCHKKNQDQAEALALPLLAPLPLPLPRQCRCFLSVLLPSVYAVCRAPVCFRDNQRAVLESASGSRSPPPRALSRKLHAAVSSIAAAYLRLPVQLLLLP